VAHACNPIYSGGRHQEITVQNQPGQIVGETLSQRTLHKIRAGRVAQGEDLEFKPQYHKKKKKPLSLHALWDFDINTTWVFLLVMELKLKHYQSHKEDLMKGFSPRFLIHWGQGMRIYFCF
jgi:hypothetical protein